jgi:O-antigen ligase
MKFFAKNTTRLLALLLLDAFLLCATAALVWFDNATNRGITYTPAPLPLPYADGPLLGVNAFNLHLEPDPTAVTRTLELAREMGAGYIRMQMPWDDVEIHGRGDFTDRRNDLDGDGQKDTISAWAKYDRIVDTAVALDLQLILRLERPPEWARQGFIKDPAFQAGLQQDGNSTGPPDDFADYGNFVGAVASRYQGRVRFYQIWNEPNLKNEWNWQTPKPEDFVALLRVGATAIRQADPAAVVLFPSLAPTDGLDFRAPMTELEYLDSVYEASGAPYFDIMSGQAYGLGQSPDEHRYVFLRGRSNWNWTRPIDTRNDVSRIVLLREIMERHGDMRKPVWIGEFGWNSAPESIPAERRTTWGEPVSEERKAEYLVAQLERARDEWPWMGVMNVWMLRYGGYAEPDPNDPTPYFALVTRDWQPLPAFAALKEHSANQVAGVGAHSWNHPAVKDWAEGGWQVRFSGTRLTIVGGLAGDIEVAIDGQRVSLTRDGLEGRQALSTSSLPDGIHTLTIWGDPAPEWFVVEREPFLPWLWPTSMGLVLLALLASSALTVRALYVAVDDLLAWRARMAPRYALLRQDALIQIGMGLGLLIFYRLSPAVPPTLIGLALFGGLAIWRPDLALRFVPLTVPFFFMPKGIWDAQFGIRDEGLRVPLHEVVVLVAAGTTVGHLAWMRVTRGFDERRKTKDESPRTLLKQSSAFIEKVQLFVFRPSSFVPVLLFLLAGTLGVVVAEQRGPALREWRWLVVEPLIFFALVVFWMRSTGAGAQTAASVQRSLLAYFLAGGALVGLLGILQFLGLNLVPLIGQKVGFSDDQILVEGVQRVNSVYGHPNNLGLYMGRIWPLAFVLVLDQRRRTKDEGLNLTRHFRLSSFVFGLTSALLALGGLLVSFSRGAWLGALAAGLVLLVMLGPQRLVRSPRFLWLLGGGALLLVLGLSAALALGIERLNPLGESSGIRLLTWASAWRMLLDYPLFGIGLDQFVALYPRYIDPSLATTNEINTAHPHNLVLDIALRMGPLGLVAFGWLVASMLRNLSRQSSVVSRHLQAGLLAALVAALVHGLVDSFYFWPDLAFAFWLFVALAWSLQSKPLAD